MIWAINNSFMKVGSHRNDDLTFQCRIDGFIISNTTVERPETLKSMHKSEAGGLSGKPLKNISDETLKTVYSLTKGE